VQRSEAKLPQTPLTILQSHAATMQHKVYLVSVFAAASNGGNMAPIVPDALGMSDSDMQEVARKDRHECGFVLPAPAGSGCDYALRFWVPNHEMEMCGHATVGAVWLLHQLGKLSKCEVSIWTCKGAVKAHLVKHDTADASVKISQPKGQVEPLASSAIASIISVLRVSPNDLAAHPVQNACTSRVKTLVPLKSATILNSLEPDFERIEQLCEDIGSTGLYPYAHVDKNCQIFEARQFPKSSGYPEDAATGIAAAALSFGLLTNGLVQPTSKTITVRQGQAMQKPSEIVIMLMPDGNGSANGCWLGGHVAFQKET